MWIQELADKTPSAENTLKEIAHQPQLWKKIWKKICAEKEEIRSFLDSRKDKLDSIVLTGAGTSAYIGISTQNCFRHKFGICAEPVSTTHIVSHPQDFFIPSKNLLMISFARSGNSPESCAAAKLADQFSENVSHFIITCNKDGQLAKDYTDKENTYVFVLPPEANDKSLAMTSSFSGMMLTSALVARIDEITSLEKDIDQLCRYGSNTLRQAPLLWDIANSDFNRAVYLGSGSLYGVAKEAQLKMQELTDGLVICKHDSFLGLRHGPKAVIDEKTFIVHHVSSDPHAMKYDMDLIVSMRKNSSPIGQIAIGENLICQEYVDWSINFEPETTPLDKDLLCVVSILPAQMLAVFKSIQLGLKADSPSRNGAISRVVQGVSIYQS